MGREFQVSRPQGGRLRSNLPDRYFSAWHKRGRDRIGDAMPRRIVTLDGKTYDFREYELPPLGPKDVRVRVTFAAPKHGTEAHAIQGSAFDHKVWDRSLRMFLPKHGRSSAPE